MIAFSGDIKPAVRRASGDPAQLPIEGLPAFVETFGRVTSMVRRPCQSARVLAVCISPGGIPKLPQDEGLVTVAGLSGDGRNHAKHIRPDRAVSLWDCEILKQLVAEGFQALVPGAAGENLTVTGLSVQSLPPGTLLRIGPVVLKLEQPRKPCYVLDAIDPRLKDAIAGRCGYLASVVEPGIIRPGMPIELISAARVERAASGLWPVASGQEPAAMLSSAP